MREVVYGYEEFLARVDRSRSIHYPILVVEGDVPQGLAGVSNPLVFWGALAKVMAEQGLSVVFTPYENHTAMFLTA